MCFSRIFFFLFFFSQRKSRVWYKECVYMCVHVWVGFFIQAKWQQQTPMIYNTCTSTKAHSAFSCTRQEYNWGSFSAYFLFGFTASLLSAISCLHIYTSLTLGKLSMILLLRSVMLCLLYPKCWRLLGTNVLLMYGSSGIYICFLLFCVALTVERNSPAGKAPALLGKDKIFRSYSSWTLCMGSSVWPQQLLLVMHVGIRRKLPHRLGHWVTEPWVLFIAFMNVIEVHLHPHKDAGRV